MIINRISHKGVWHAEAGAPNQDAAAAGQTEEGACAIVCDGVSLNHYGELSHSEIASAFCARTGCALLKETLEKNTKNDEMEQAIALMMSQTLELLDVDLQEKGIEAHDAQTTMIAAVLKDGVLSAGLAGDGGIIYRTRDGKTGVVVTRIKTSSAVYPLSARDYWKFCQCGSLENPVTDAMLASDGVFDQFVALAREQIFFDEPAALRFFDCSQDERNEQYERWIDEMPGGDDQTIVVLSDREESIRKNS